MRLWLFWSDFTICVLKNKRPENKFSFCLREAGEVRSRADRCHRGVLCADEVPFWATLWGCGWKLCTPRWEPHHPSDSQTNCCDGEAQLPATGEGFLIFSEFINRSYVLHIYYKSAVTCHCSVPHQCSSQMFKKLESILSERFSQFQPRSLVDVMHACIHLERFPLNYMTKVFSPHFLQKLQGTCRAFISDCEKQEERKKSVTVHFWVFPYFLSERDDVCYLLLKHSGWETLFCFLNLTFSLVAVTLF